jgi:hypothetical protein
MYAGRIQGSTDAAKANVCELWTLAHRFQVYGMKEWLTQNCLNDDCVCAAMHFACGCEDSAVCESLLQACRMYASCSLPRMSEASLKGIGGAAVCELWCQALFPGLRCHVFCCLLFCLSVVLCVCMHACMTFDKGRLERF